MALPRRPSQTDARTESQQAQVDQYMYLSPIRGQRRRNKKGK